MRITNLQLEKIERKASEILSENGGNLTAEIIQDLDLVSILADLYEELTGLEYNPKNDEQTKEYNFYKSFLFLYLCK